MFAAKSTFYKEQAPKQVGAYLEKIKDIPRERLIYIDETGNIRTVNTKIASTFALAGIA